MCLDGGDINRAFPGCPLGGSSLLTSPLYKKGGGMSSTFCIMCKKNFFYFTRYFGYILHSGQGEWGQGGLEYHAVQNGAAGGGFWTGGGVEAESRA